MLAAALNNLTSLVTGESRINHLTELLQALIDLCLNQSPAEEQNELARQIDKLFNSATAKLPALYDFLTAQPPKSRKKLLKKLKTLKSSTSADALASASSKSKKPTKKISKKTAKKVPQRKGMPSPNISTSTANNRRLVSADSARSRRFSASTTSTSYTNLSAAATAAIQPGSSSSSATKSSTPSSSIDTLPINESNSSVTFVSGATGKQKAENRLIQLLKAIELASDPLTVMVLCRLLEGYVTVGSAAVRQRHLRQLARLDAANFLLRTIRAHLSDPTPTPFVVMATEVLITTTVRACAKDTKLLLKIRLIGLLQLLAIRILEVDRIHCTLVLLKFTCKALKSPRNSQLMGRDRQFAERFTNILVAFNAIECADSVDYVPRTTNPDAYSAADKMARLVEILFYVTKNRKNKLYLLDQGVIGVLKNIYKNHFERRGLDLVHSEIALIAVAVIRHLSKTRRAKDELANLKILEMCENSIAQLAEDRVKFANKKQLLTNSLQLQDSLCALCIRCLPQLPFPIPTNNFPLTFPLPPDANQPPKLPQPRTKHGSISSTTKARPVSKLRKDRSVDNNDSAIDEADSDDDGGGEEEDSFMGFTGSRLLADGENEEEMSDDDTCTGDRAGLPKYNRQKLAELKENYAFSFSELTSPTNRENESNSSGPSSHRDRIVAHCQQTKSVGNFVKIAYPELADPNIETERRDLLVNQESMRETVIQKLAKARVQAQAQKPRIVYDLDHLCHDAAKHKRSAPLTNNDIERCGRFVAGVDHLCFESRFESGNLRAAIQATDTHYELVLSPDINEARPHYQWFYFEVSNNQPNVSYTFEIINCLKNTSMFSKGMQPVIFSVTEAKNGRPGWVRAGQSVCYYRNLYFSAADCPVEKKAQPPPPGRRRTQSIGPAIPSTPSIKGKQPPMTANGTNEVKSYFSIRFTIRFRHAADVCYIAYHYPYTFSYLKSTLEYFLAKCSTKSTSMYFRSDRLAQSLAGNPLHLLTITAAGTTEEIRSRPIVLLMARVHPGESNASWIMHGVLNALTADTDAAHRLRQRFLFKVIPCLNPDGVINGNHRCSLAGIDLNRVWDQPSSTRHPTIYHAKGLVQYMVEIIKRPPFCIVDLHGHSRKSNIFTYGNNPEESWRTADQSLPNSGQVMVLPELLDRLGQGFSLRDCRFSVTKSKESSARITLWRQFGVERCYTMESTYCGFDVGSFSGKQIGVGDLKRMGEHLVSVLEGVHEAAAQGNKSIATPMKNVQL